MSSQLLFVTYKGGSHAEGFPYAMDLARMLSKDVKVLVVQKTRKFIERFDDLMSAVTFAEAGEHETALEMMGAKGLRAPAIKGSARGATPASPMTPTGEVPHMNGAYTSARGDGDHAAFHQSGVAGVHVDVLSSEGRELVPAVTDVLKKERRIDIVILSPSITEGGSLNAHELKRLMRSTSRPIVTMARQNTTEKSGRA